MGNRNSSASKSSSSTQLGTSTTPTTVKPPTPTPSLTSNQPTSLSTRGVTSSRTAPERNVTKRRYRVRGVGVFLVHGCIAKEWSDCIVHGTNSDIDFKGQAGQALLKVGGQGITKAGRISNICKEGPAGNLPCTAIIHVDIHQGKTIGWTQLILNCLEKAEELGYSTISIPLLGTGGCKQPVSTIAKCFKEALNEYIFTNNGTLTIIRIITFDDDNIDPLHSELSCIRDRPKTPQPAHVPTFAPRNLSTPQLNHQPRTRTNGVNNITKHTYKFRGLEIRLIQGCITKESTDCVVHGTNDSVDFKGAIGQALVKAGGNGIIVTGTISGICIEGPSGNLSCNAIIHTDIHKAKQHGWQKIILACLEKAEESYTSIALPLLGTGLFKQSIDNITRYFRESLEQYLGQRNRSLQEIHIVTLDPTYIDSLHRELSLIRHSPAKNAQGGPQRHQPRSSNNIKHTLHMGVNVNIVLGSIAKENTDCIVHPTNANVDYAGMIGKAILKEAGPGLQIGGVKIRDVCIETHAGNLLCQKIIHLNIHKISDYSWDELILKCLTKADEIGMSSISIPIIGTGQMGKKIDQVASYFKDAIESFTCYNGTQLNTINIITIDTSYVSVLYDELNDQSAQAQAPTPNAPPLSPVNKYTKGLGHNWTMMKIHDPPKKEIVDPASSEYTSISTKFTKDVPTASISKMERIQSPILKASYRHQKKMLKRLWKYIPKSNRPTSISRRLWHGCPGDSAEKIRQSGFNRSYCGQNGTSFGQGVYFAKQASYSADDKYSKPDSNGNKYIFLCDVITGLYTKGSTAMKEPPRKDPTNPNAGYHSVVNNETNPEIFVVFKDDVAYPEYLITFT